MVEDDVMVKDDSELKDSRDNRWNYIHSFLKNMVLNLITTASYAGRVLVKPTVKKPEDIKRDKTRAFYECIMEAYDEWLKIHVHRPGLISDVKNLINIAFTIIDEDWVYADLLDGIMVKLGERYYTTRFCQTDKLKRLIDKAQTELQRRYSPR